MPGCGRRGKCTTPRRLGCRARAGGGWAAAVDTDGIPGCQVAWRARSSPPLERRLVGWLPGGPGHRGQQGQRHDDQGDDRGWPPGDGQGGQAGTGPSPRWPPRPSPGPAEAGLRLAISSAIFPPGLLRRGKVADQGTQLSPGPGRPGGGPAAGSAQVESARGVCLPQHHDRGFRVGVGGPDAAGIGRPVVPAASAGLPGRGPGIVTRPPVAGALWRQGPPAEGRRVPSARRGGPARMARRYRRAGSR